MVGGLHLESASLDLDMQTEDKASAQIIPIICWSIAPRLSSEAPSLRSFAGILWESFDRKSGFKFVEIITMF